MVGNSLVDSNHQDISCSNEYLTPNISEQSLQQGGNHVSLFILQEKYRLDLYVYDEDALGEHDIITIATGLYQPEKTNVFQTIPLNYSHISESFRQVNIFCNKLFQDK